MKTQEVIPRSLAFDMLFGSNKIDGHTALDLIYGGIEARNLRLRNEVLTIVDRCFHAYASHYRNDAREMAEELITNIE